jgi:hypothetical protein
VGCGLSKSFERSINELGQSLRQGGREKEDVSLGTAGDVSSLERGKGLGIRGSLLSQQRRRAFGPGAGHHLAAVTHFPRSEVC